MKPEILTSTARNPALQGKCALGIVIKTPRDGFSKTRLCPPFSPDEAAGISRCFIKDISATIASLGAQDAFVVGVAVYTPAGSEAELAPLLPPEFKMIAQRETDFGCRLLAAIQDLFAVGFAAVCLINGDSPTLPFQYLQSLASFLESPKDRIVIGPSQDGGYYALGLRQAHPRLFQEITWNTDRVYAETIERAKEIDVPAISLPAWYDVDNQLTLHRLLSELFPESADAVASPGAAAPHTRDFLRQMLLQDSTAARIWPQRETRCGLYE